MASVTKVIHTDNQLHAGQFDKTAYTEWILFVAGNTVDVVLTLFMALLSFRGISTPSLTAQGEQRRSSYFNIRRGDPLKRPRFWVESVSLRQTGTDSPYERGQVGEQVKPNKRFSSPPDQGLILQDLRYKGPFLQKYNPFLLERFPFKWTIS
jgi:hypothetical protein